MAERDQPEGEGAMIGMEELPQRPIWQHYQISQREN